MSRGARIYLICRRIQIPFKAVLRARNLIHKVIIKFSVIYFIHKLFLIHQSILSQYISYLSKLITLRDNYLNLFADTALSVISKCLQKFVISHRRIDRMSSSLKNVFISGIHFKQRRIFYNAAVSKQASNLSRTGSCGYINNIILSIAV